MDLNEYLDNIVKSVISNTSIIKRVKGVVVDVSNDAVSVKINSPKPYNDTTIMISNQTRMIPTVGASVWVYFWKNIADGFILPANMHGVGQFYEGNETIEIFSDYSGTNGINLQSGSLKNLGFITLAGTHQKVNITGNKEVWGLSLLGDNNTVNAGTQFVLRSSINGNNNTSDLKLSQTHIIGSRNVSRDSSSSIIIGHDNNVSVVSNCYVFGYNNGLTGAFSNIASGISVFGSGAKCSASAYATYGAAAIGANPTLNDSTTAIAFGMSSPLLDHNGMKLTTSGDLNVYGAVNANHGADYAEYEEWKDGNTENEDRRGRFVMETREYIRLADSNDDADDVLGIVSASPTICGDAHSMNWKGRFKKDIFGSLIYEEQEFTDDDGNTKTVMAEVTSPEYDSKRQYIARSDRKEFSPIAYIGKVVVVDDGTCEVDGYCKPSKGGIATKSNERTRFRVRKRIDDTHILVRIR